MKIYEIGTGYTPIPAQMGAATEIVVEELTRSFLNLEQDVQILDIKAKERPQTDLPIEEVKVPGMFTKNDVSLGIVHKLKRVVYSISLARKLKKILKAAKEPVVLHFHNQYNLFFFLKLTSKKLRKKAIIAYTVHSYIWGTQWDEIKDTVKKKYFQEVFCVQNADLVLVLNDITIDHFVNRLGVKPESIQKIINGVNTRKYSPLSAEEIAQVKKDLGMENKQVIFQVGSVCDRKNQLGSAEMLCNYLRENPNVVYMYAGGIIDGEYKAKIDALAKEKGIENQVVYAGELAPGTQLNQYYNMASCSIFTSKLESFGLVIIEAISSGTPVVMSNNLMFDLQSGYALYDTDEEFIEKVDAVLKADQKTANSAEVVEKYNWDTVAKQHARFFQRHS